MVILTATEALVLAIVCGGVLGVGLLARWILSQLCRRPEDVMYRQAVGLLLIVGGTAVYCLCVGWSVQWLLAVFALSLVVGSTIVILHKEKLMPYKWDGLTENGNLTHKAIRHSENALTALGSTRNSLRDDLEIIELQIRQVSDKYERELAVAQIEVGDLRYMRRPSSSRDVRRRADEQVRQERERRREWPEHLTYGDEEARP